MTVGKNRIRCAHSRCKEVHSEHYLSGAPDKIIRGLPEGRIVSISGLTRDDMEVLRDAVTMEARVAIFDRLQSERKIIIYKLPAHAGNKTA